jgi:hypothetical protein
LDIKAAEPIQTQKPIESKPAEEIKPII